MLFQYWENVDGKPRHWFYDLCMATVRRHHPHVRVIGKEEAREIIGGIPAALDGHYIAMRSDWIRKMIAVRLGALYLDCDVICHRPLTSIEAMAEDFDFVCFKEWQDGWMDSLFACRKDSPFVQCAADFALEQFTRYRPAPNAPHAGPGELPWLATNRWAIDHALKVHPWCNWLELQPHTINPIHCGNRDWWLAETDEPIEHICLCRVASAHSLRPGLASMTERQFMASRMRVARLIRRGLGLDEFPAATIGAAA